MLAKGKSLKHKKRKSEILVTFLTKISISRIASRKNLLCEILRSSNRIL